MQIQTISTKPYINQKPGTSGLRQKTRVFLDNPLYLENYIQAIFNTFPVQNKKMLLGGDGRFYNDKAIQVILKMAVAAGVREVLVGQGGLFSTPALASSIVKQKADCGILLSASHNPAGPDGDFGIKFNLSNGGPAPERVMQGIYENAQKMMQIHIAQMPDVDLSQITDFDIGSTQIRIIDPLKDYIKLMESLFDFEAIRALFKSGFRMQYDAMNAVTGPYAKELFERHLNAPQGTVMRGTPLQDFGGIHADPNLVYGKALVDKMYADDAPDFGAASDGDGDRNMVLGRHFFINPNDSVAVMADNAALVKGYQMPILGVARSMPTAPALDKVAQAKGFNLYEVPTGWKFFGSLLDSGLASICGEESFAQGSYHLREKDGLWAILFWLNILAKSHKTPQEIVEAHWQKYGRDYYVRQDYEGLKVEDAQALMEDLKAQLPSLAEQSIDGLKISKADVFDYTDPVNGDEAKNQGIRIYFENGSRIVYRLSATGTQGATLRVYLSTYEKQNIHQTPTGAVALLANISRQLGKIEHFTGMNVPSVET